MNPTFENNNSQIWQWQQTGPIFPLCGCRKVGTTPRLWQRTKSVKRNVVDADRCNSAASVKKNYAINSQSGCSSRLFESNCCELLPNEYLTFVFCRFDELTCHQCIAVQELLKYGIVRKLPTWGSHTKQKYWCHANTHRNTWCHWAFLKWKLNNKMTHVSCSFDELTCNQHIAVQEQDNMHVKYKHACEWCLCMAFYV